MNEMELEELERRARLAGEMTFREFRASIFAPLSFDEELRLSRIFLVRCAQAHARAKSLPPWDRPDED